MMENISVGMGWYSKTSRNPILMGGQGDYFSTVVLFRVIENYFRQVLIQLDLSVGITRIEIVAFIC